VTQAANVRPRLVGRYALYGAIASGGMATVHFGRLLGPVGFSRTVAIKRLHAQFAADPDFASMFLDEARLVARIRHPNVVPTLDIIADQGELFLVMEYAAGESLARLLKTTKDRGERIPVPLVATIMVGALQGLHAAHEAKDERGQPLDLVHRDVSPHNIHVGTDGVTRVIDFGVAKAAGRIQTTRDGQIKGKLAYMPPEQLRGGEVTRQSDVFAAGICLWEMLCGFRLFQADNEGAVIAKVLSGNIEAPSRYLTDPAKRDAALLTGQEHLAALDAVVLRALATDPDDRFTTAREMARALEQAVRLASISEVGDFVERNAQTILKQRADIVAEIESSTSYSAEELAQAAALATSGSNSAFLQASGGHPASGRALGSGSHSFQAVPSLATTGTGMNAAGVGTGSGVTFVPSGIQPAVAAPPASAPFPRAIIFALLAAVLVMSAVAVFVAVRLTPPKDPTANAGVPSASASTPATAVPPATAATSAVATASTTATVPTPTPSAVDAGPPDAGKPSGSSGRGGSTSGGHSSSSGGGKNCDFEAYYDSSGTRQYREVCK
jgi:serine/threonine-protein kinase